MKFPQPTFPLILAIAMILAISSPSAALADVYRYVDKNGVMHFTDAPTTSKFQLYFSERANTDDIIRYYAQRFGLEPALLCAIVKVESDYNPKAVSSKGALGLMQLIPTTAEELAVMDPLDVNENVRGGCQYLKQMLTRFSGDLDLALAAYNAGPSAVQRHNGIPPFKETIDYVNKVKHYLEIFRSRDEATL
jgi:soluble lytic murein transglycosylase-like protein